MTAESHVRVYSGVFVPGADYKKFDVVEASGAPGTFYYAKDDIVAGGGASIGPTVFEVSGGYKGVWIGLFFC